MGTGLPFILRSSQTAAPAPLMPSKKDRTRPFNDGMAVKRTSPSPVSQDPLELLAYLMFSLSESAPLVLDLRPRLLSSSLGSYGAYLLSLSKGGTMTLLACQPYPTVEVAYRKNETEKD